MDRLARQLMIGFLSLVLCTGVLLSATAQQRPGRRNNNAQTTGGNSAATGFRPKSLHLKGGTSTSSGLPLTVSVGSARAALATDSMVTTLTPMRVFQNGAWTGISNAHPTVNTLALKAGQTSASTTLQVPHTSANTEYQLQVLNPSNKKSGRMTFTADAITQSASKSGSSQRGPLRPRRQKPNEDPPITPGAGFSAVSFDVMVAPQNTSTIATLCVGTSNPTDTIITLSSTNSQVASVPATVTVPAGQTSITFTVTLGSPGTATVSATWTGNSTSCDVTVDSGSD